MSRNAFIAICSILLCLTHTSAHPDLIQHFKKAENKDGYHGFRNVDFIYVINLDKRPNKFQACLQQLQSYDINPYRFSAVNGYNLSLEELNDIGVVLAPGMKMGEEGSCYSIGTNGLVVRHCEPMDHVGRTYFQNSLGEGSVGCALSHLSVLQDAWDSNDNAV